MEDKKIDWNKPAYPPTIEFKKEGDACEGIVIGFGDVQLYDKEKDVDYMAKFITLKVGNEDRTVWLTGVIENRIIELNVDVGDYIGILYRGERKNKAGTQTYKDYDVRKI